MSRAGVRFTRAEIADLQRRGAAPQQPRMIGGGVVFCAPGRLSNPLNRLKGAHWTAETGYRSLWHEKVAAALVEAGYRRGNLNPRLPKLIIMRAHVLRLFDSKTEGLQAALKPIPDALQQYGVIDSDADASPHEFYPEQVVDPTWLGVEVTVRPLPDANAPTPKPDRCRLPQCRGVVRCPKVPTCAD